MDITPALINVHDQGQGPQHAVRAHPLWRPGSNRFRLMRIETTKTLNVLYGGKISTRQKWNKVSDDEITASELAAWTAKMRKDKEPATDAVRPRRGQGQAAEHPQLPRLQIAGSAEGRVASPPRNVQAQVPVEIRERPVSEEQHLNGYD